MKACAVRLRPGRDVRLSLEALCRQECWSAAVILGCVGSLTQVSIRYAGRKELHHTEGDLEILSLNGTLGLTGGHLHIMVSDAEGRCWGGHLGRGAIVRTTAEIVIGILPELSFERTLDKETGYPELEVKMLIHPKSESEE